MGKGANNPQKVRKQWMQWNPKQRHLRNDRVGVRTCNLGNKLKKLELYA